jgi:hypothetical protein
LNLGIFVAYWTGYGFTSVTGSKAWRIPVAMQAIFIVPLIVLVFIVPESPRWLASHGRAEEALSVLARLQGKPIDHQDVVIQFQEIQTAVMIETAVGSGSWSDLFKEDKICSRRRLLIACSVQFFQQIGGINAIIFYAGTFFGLVSDKGALLAGGLFTWFFVASFIPWLLIDTAGRRKLFLICISGMAIAFAIESALVWKTTSQGPDTAAAGAAIAVLFVYMGLFTVSPACMLESVFQGQRLQSDRIPSNSLGLPIRDFTPPSPTERLVYFHSGQLAHQLRRRANRPYRCREHWLQVLHRECLRSISLRSELII